MSLQDLKDACEDIYFSALAKSRENLLPAPSNSGFEIGEDQQRQMSPYIDLEHVAAALYDTMRKIEADDRRKCFMDQERYHDRLLGIRALRERWIDKDTPQDVVDGIASLYNVTGPVQSAFFQSLKGGGNPEKKEYCDTVAERFWGIGQDSEFKWYCIADPFQRAT
jgi:hypothetical protein